MSSELWCGAQCSGWALRFRSPVARLRETGVSLSESYSSFFFLRSGLRLISSMAELSIRGIVHVVPVEELVPEVVLVLDFADLVEVVHVELAHERRVVAVLEVHRQHRQREGLLVQHHEADAVGRPPDDLRVVRVLESPGTLPTGSRTSSSGRWGCSVLSSLSCPVRSSSS